ncbi:MAG: hypothetical protein HZB59_09340 [Ignavibacteriales bacterium]|nr:hypothetical protein [Ignavibacteriales bacterium]
MNSQTNPKFNVSLSLDYSAAEQYIALLEDQPVSTQQIARLRGNRIAASTTGLISDDRNVTGNLLNHLDSLKYHQIIHADIYHLEEARSKVSEIKQLLEELKKRNFSKRVTATVEQIFPNDAEVSIDIPIFIVALGHENADAYVRRIIWHGDSPEFTGNDDGELTIVVNLSSAVRYGSDVEDRFISLLGVVAHEVFHAAFGNYKESSSSWKEYYTKPQSPIDALLDLTQNEGIAYYLSLEQQGGGYLPHDWNDKTRNAFTDFNKYSSALLTDTVTNKTVFEILRKANLSGYWNSYGSITGMVMAREIDRQMGRESLIEAISKNPFYFFRKYIELTEKGTNLPKFPKRLNSYILRNSE